CRIGGGWEANLSGKMVAASRFTAGGVLPPAQFKGSRWRLRGVLWDTAVSLRPAPRAAFGVRHDEPDDLRPDPGSDDRLHDHELQRPRAQSQRGEARLVQHRRALGAAAR